VKNRPKKMKTNSDKCNKRGVGLLRITGGALEVGQVLGGDTSHRQTSRPCRLARCGWSVRGSKGILPHTGIDWEQELSLTVLSPKATGPV
jgi:hypothetical protein